MNKLNKMAREKSNIPEELGKHTEDQNVHDFEFSEVAQTKKYSLDNP
jgi:hypothetical protein